MAVGEKELNWGMLSVPYKNLSGSLTARDDVVSLGGG